MQTYFKPNLALIDNSGWAKPPKIKLAFRPVFYCYTCSVVCVCVCLLQGHKRQPLLFLSTASSLPSSSFQSSHLPFPPSALPFLLGDKNVLYTAGSYTNILIRRFSHCSFNVKLRLFRSFCICFYDTALWRHVKATVVNKFKSAYVKCLKGFFNFHKYSSVPDMFLQLGLTTFCTVSHNAEWSFLRCNELCSNMLVRLVTKFCVVSP